MALRAMAEAEDLHRLSGIANESREQSRRHEELLASELSSVVLERDQFRLELDKERAELEEERMMGEALHNENKDLREDRERLYTESAQQCKLLQIQGADVAKAWLERRNERECQALHRYEEEYAMLEREATELREDQERLRALADSHASHVVDERNLCLHLQEKDKELQEEREMHEYYISRAQHEQTESSILQKHLESERLKLQDETVRRVYLERVTTNLTGEKEALASRYAAAVAEIGVFRDQERQLDAQVSALRRRLVHEQEELQTEQHSHRRLIAETEEMEASHACLKSELELEASRVNGVREAAASMILYDDTNYWRNSSFPSSCAADSRLHQISRDGNPFTDGSDHMTHLEEVCRTADAEVAAQAKAMRLNDSLRRQLCAETKFAVHEAEELRIAMDARAAAQSEELREAEVRRQQLEAETSLMAMEVATLSKDLGGRLLEDGALGLTRRPFTIHDILREAWRSGTIPTDHSFRSSPTIVDDRQRGKAARDAYFVNLYLKWLRRGPYRHRLHISGIPSYHPAAPRTLSSHTSRGIKGLANHHTGQSPSGKR